MKFHYIYILCIHIIIETGHHTPDNSIYSNPINNPNHNDINGHRHITIQYNHHNNSSYNRNHEAENEEIDESTMDYEEYENDDRESSSIEKKVDRGDLFTGKYLGFLLLRHEIG